MDKRFIGKESPFIIVGAIVLCWLAIQFLWGLGLFIDVLILVVAAVCMIIPGPIRRAATAVVIGCALTLGGFAVAVVVS